MSGELAAGVEKGWFLEINNQWPGQAMGIKVTKSLFEGKSDYQDVKVFETETYGKMMVLDGVIQTTQRDEFSYHEMIANLPLFSHPNPEKVCVIGGGDGGVLREVMRHPGVKSAVLCDIDAVVIEQSRIHLKHISVGFDDPRSEVLCGDGFAFLKDKKGEYDVIIVDSSDPDGPAGALFGEEFYKVVQEALRPGGIVCAQGECQWLHLDLISSMMACCRGIFSTVQYAYTCIPTYPSGQIGFLLCAKGEGTTFHAPARKPTPEHQDAMQYYSSDMHRAAFVLPEFARKRLAITLPPIA
ncbi:spermidine synthase [Baffinella frigidus]|nr:spermidine synthase [Cryptophyta sp. CCMP2293]